MKTTLDLPEDLMRKVKLRAVMQRRPLKDLVADMLRQGMGMAQKRVHQHVGGAFVGTHRH